LALGRGEWRGLDEGVFDLPGWVLGMSEGVLRDEWSLCGDRLLWLVVLLSLASFLKLIGLELLALQQTTGEVKKNDGFNY
jgi:hypothetical protein